MNFAKLLCAIIVGQNFGGYDLKVLLMAHNLPCEKHFAAFHSFNQEYIYMLLLQPSEVPSRK